jgi:hypothetical protein
MTRCPRKDRDASGQRSRYVPAGKIQKYRCCICRLTVLYEWVPTALGSAILTPSADVSGLASQNDVLCGLTGTGCAGTGPFRHAHEYCIRRHVFSVIPCRAMIRSRAVLQSPFHELLKHRYIAATTIDEMTRRRKRGKNNVRFSAARRRNSRST